jgi:prophage regulatory protein
MAPKSQKPLRVLRLPEVIAKTGLGRDSIYRLSHGGGFPKRVKLSERASGWLEHEVDQYLAERAADRDAAAEPFGAVPPATGGSLKSETKECTSRARGKKHLQPPVAA